MKKWKAMIIAVFAAIYLIGGTVIGASYYELRSGDNTREEGAMLYASIQGTAGGIERLTKSAFVGSVVFVESPIIIPAALASYIGIEIFSKFRSNYFVNEFVNPEHPVSHQLAEAMVSGLVGAIFWVIIAFALRRRYGLRVSTRNGEKSPRHENVGS